MKQRLKSWKKHALLGITALLVAVMGTLSTTGVAHAAGCRVVNVGLSGLPQRILADWTTSYQTVWATDWTSSPSWATSCKDVNIGYPEVPGNPYPQCIDVRVRKTSIYEVSSWQRLCRGDGYRVVWTGIYSSTYRVEAAPVGNVFSRPYYSIKD